MRKYKYQLHTHTIPCSDCSRMTPWELVKGLYECNFSGAVLTNHFINGNTGISRKLPWNEFVQRYEDDYRRCREYSKKFNVDIFFGIEEHIGGGLEILCYGITPQMLYEHPELQEKSLEKWSEVVHSYGGICIQAHPFRDTSHNPEKGVLPAEYIDGIEVFNAGNDLEENLRAREFAVTHPGIIKTSGADAHQEKRLRLGGIETERRINDEKDLVSILKSGEYILR